METKATQIEKLISQILNESGLPIDTAYYLVLSLAKELKILMLETSAQNEEETYQQIEIPVTTPEVELPDLSDTQE